MKKPNVVNVLNGQKASFETMPREMEIESYHGKIVNKKMYAKAIDQITGNLEVVDWKKCKKRFPYLCDIDFPVISDNKSIDLLIGVDYAELHVSLKDMLANPGSPLPG